MNNYVKKRYKYCTFWYPTIFHRNLTVVPGRSEDKNRTICNKEVSDDSGSSYLVSITLDQQENLIVMSRLNNDEKEEFTVTLKKLKSSRNGFCQYRFNPNEIRDGKISEFEDMLKKGIYHIAKEFYHTHEADSGKDSALKGRITNYQVNLSQDDNEHLIGFLKNYATIFEDYAKTVSDTNIRICEIDTIFSRLKKSISVEENKEKKEKLDKELANILDELLKTINSTNNYCEIALIEYTYYKTLLNSRYNKSFHHQLLVDEYMNKVEKTKKENKEQEKVKFKNECRIKALNIESAISYIQNIHCKNQNRLHNVSHILIDQVNNTAQDVNTILSNINKILDKSEYMGKQSRDLSFFSLLIGLIFGISTLISIPKSTLVGVVVILISICFFTRILYLNNKYKKQKGKVI